MTLPRRIIPIKNPDKEFHEHWYNGRCLMNIPHPFRCVLLGPPNVGKTTICKNLILRAQPPFQEIFVIHCDPAYTEEYNDLGDGCTVLEDIPSPDEWEGKVKTLVILDDLEFKFMSKDQVRNLGRLFGFVSTHKNISVALTSQDPFNVPAPVRRCANLWVLWKMSDMDALSTCARRTGMKALTFKKIFNKLITEPHDSLWIDMTDKTPLRVRKNCYTSIVEGRQPQPIDDDDESLTLNK